MPPDGGPRFPFKAVGRLFAAVSALAGLVAVLLSNAPLGLKIGIAVALAAGIVSIAGFYAGQLAQWRQQRRMKDEQEGRRREETPTASRPTPRSTRLRPPSRTRRRGRTYSDR